MLATISQILTSTGSLSLGGRDTAAAIQILLVVSIALLSAAHANRKNA